MTLYFKLFGFSWWHGLIAILVDQCVTPNFGTRHYHFGRKNNG